MKTKTEREAVAPVATIELANLRDFFAELRKDSRYVDRGIVRVAESRRASAMSPLLFVSVVGIARVGADIYRVECICEVLCGVEVADRRVIAGTHKQRKILWNCRTDLGLYVQSGMLEKSAL